MPKRRLLRQVFILFAKLPRLGQAKTRMKPLLNDRECLQLHRLLIQLTAKKMKALHRVHRAVFFTGKLAAAHRAARNLKLEKNFEIDVQQGSDLGERMAKAMNRYLDSGATHVVILGSDHPTVPTEFLREAFRRLETRDVVLGPTDDGGYYLIGARSNLGHLLQGIPWSTPCVLQETLKKMRGAGRSYSLLRKWYDVDRPGDLPRFQKDCDDPTARRLIQKLRDNAAIRQASLKKSTRKHAGSPKRS